MRVRLPFLFAALVVALFSPLWWRAVLVLLPGFGVELVEITGARLLAPHHALALAGVREGESVWSHPERWAAGLRRHPLVAGVEVERELPGTLRIRVRERRPVALVERAALRPVSAAGALLPVNPATAGLDLPLIRGAKEQDLVRTAARISSQEPELFRRLSEVARTPAGDVLLTFAAPPVEAILPPRADDVSLLRLRAVLLDLERRHGTRPLAGRVIDLRFAGQAVLRAGQTHTPSS